MLPRSKAGWIAAAAVAVVASSLGLATSWSYLKTAWRGVGQSVRELTPIGFDLERLAGLIADLQPEIRRNQQVAVQLEVEREYLEKDIAAMEGQQEKAKAEMAKLRQTLAQGGSQFQFAGQKYSRQQVEQDLARRLDQYEERQTQLAAKKQLLAERQRTLEAATAKVNEYRRQYEQLQERYESLKAELALAEAAQAAGNLQFDSSKLAQAKDLAQEVEKRIRVVQKMVESDRQPSGEIPVQADTQPVAERYDRLFGPSGKSGAKDSGV
ncbi:MAG: hypothetical protein NUV77_23255 [Thermoguttaceae bacterium]|jgi:chromosome segregation ATPase|nr:hypothetical protein [Thermoguttaceae bacterium]